MGELVLDCVLPYIQDNDDLTSISLVFRKYLDDDSLTRKRLTVHVHYLPDPSRLSLRFPNLESLTLKSYSYGFGTADRCFIPVTPWILAIVVGFTRLKSLCIRNMVVFDSDLKLLAATRGTSLRSLEIHGCKMFSVDGLIDIARYCIDLRSLSLQKNHIENGYEGGYRPDGKWLHELDLRNTVMESLDFDYPFVCYYMKDVTRLAKNCSNTLVFLNIFPRFITEFRQVFNHAKKLEHFIGIINKDWDYSGVKFPSNIRGLRIVELREASFPFLLPYLNQLWELDIECANYQPNCVCFLIKRCPSLEVLVTQDICGDEGLQVIAQSCKNLHKLNHRWKVTHLGLIALAQGCLILDYLNIRLLDNSNEALECI